MCPSCKVRRNHNVSNPRPCLLCGSKDVPIPYAQQEIKLHVGDKTWIFDATSSTSSRKISTPDSPDAIGSDRDPQTGAQSSNLTEALKSSVSAPVSDLSADPPTVGQVLPEASSLCDYVLKKTRNKVPRMDFMDTALAAAANSIGEEVPIDMGDQVTEAFNPVLLQAKLSLPETTNHVAPILEVQADPKNATWLKENAKAEYEAMMDINEGALQVEDSSTQGGSCSSLMPCSYGHL